MKCCKCYIDITDHVFKNKDYELCKECVEAFIKAPSVVFNEVLAYANTYRSSSGKNNVIECLVINFTSDELDDAKALLLKEFSCLTDPAHRRGSDRRTKSEAVAKDIIEFFKELDDKKIEVTFAAVNLIRLPTHKPEEYNMMTVLDRLIDIESRLNVHDTNITANKNVISIHEKNIGENINAIKSLNTEIDSQKNTMNNIEDTVSKKIALEIVKNDLLLSKPSRSPTSSGSLTAVGSASISNGNRSGSVPNVMAPAGAPVVSNAVSASSISMASPAIKPSYAASASKFLPNTPVSQTFLSYNGSSINQSNAWQVAGAKRRKRGCNLYGKGNTDNGKQLGANLPSRHVVLERVLKTTSKEELMNKLKEYNPHVNIRSLELLTKSDDSRFHMYKLEVSVEDLGKVMDPNNIPAGIGIRPFWFKKPGTASSGNG